MSRPGAVQCASASRVGPVFWYSTESFIDLFRAAFRYCVSRLHSGLFTPLSKITLASCDVHSQNTSTQTIAFTDTHSSPPVLFYVRKFPILFTTQVKTYNSSQV